MASTSEAIMFVALTVKGMKVLQCSDGRFLLFQFH